MKKTDIFYLCIYTLILHSCSDPNIAEVIPPLEEDSPYCSFKLDGQEYYFAVPKPQEGSYFRITSFELVDSNKLARIKGEFSARVYDRYGKCMVLEDGRYCADLWYDF